MPSLSVTTTWTVEFMPYKVYEKKLIETRYESLGHKQTLYNETKGNKGGFEVDDKVHFRRTFEDINKKIRYFPLKEDNAFFQLQTFDDDYGQVYAYRWRNKQDGGWVSFWARFSKPENIDIDQESKVSSGCFMMCDYGKLNLKNTKLIDTEIWAFGEVKLETCEKIKNCYIRGSVDIKQTKIEEGYNRFINHDSEFMSGTINIEQCEFKGNNLFWQDTYYNATISLSQCKLDGNLEFYGGVSATNSQFKGTGKFAGNVNFGSGCTIKDSPYIDAGKSGSISIGKGSTIKESPIILKNASIGSECTLSGNCFISDHVTVGQQSKISGNCVILHRASIGQQCEISGNCLINMFAQVGQQCKISGHATVTGHANLAGQNNYSDYAIIAGTATHQEGKSSSGTARLFNNWSDQNGLSGKDRHWDTRSGSDSCKIFKLVDEAEDCLTCGTNNKQKCKTDSPDSSASDQTVF